MNRPLALVLLLIFNILSSKALELSSQAQISLLTCDAGKELYTAFGHSAIRVSDPVQGVDYVFNYGTFSFSTPNFYVKFIRGKLNYQLSASYCSNFTAEYISDNRSIHEQILNLNQKQKQTVYNFLENNYLPQNRYYKYDFFYDNCATRIRDLFVAALKSEFQYREPNPKENKSFRNLVNSYLVYSPWSDLGLNLGLARPTDKIMNSMEYMFLPDFVATAFSRAVIIREGKEMPFVLETRFLFKSVPEVSEYQFIRPWTVFSFLLIIVIFITYWEHKKNRNVFWVDALIFSVIGWLGMLQLFLWTATDHQACYQNWNLLWALPSHVVFGFMLFKNKISKFGQRYFLTVGIFTFVVMCFALANAFPQPYDNSLSILLAAIIIRSLKIGLIAKG